MIRLVVPPPADATSAGRGPARAGRDRGPGKGLPPDSPYTHPDYSYKPNEWNPLEVILDANILRVWINDVPEGGTTNGQADEEIASLWPRSPVRRRHRGSTFQASGTYGWSATAADINHDGILDIVSGPFYYLGPDLQSLERIYLSKTSDVSSQLAPGMVNFPYDYTGDGWPDVLISKGELRRWDQYDVLPAINSEIAIFKDVDGDEKPGVAFVGGGAVSWAGPDPGNPTAPWILSRLSLHSRTALS